jgi:glycosyltransferase involved in cell wall biosynthesis
LRETIEGILPTAIVENFRTYTADQLRRKYENAYKQFLEIISDANRNPVFLFPPSLDWYTQLFQRPQQIARALARAGVKVFYFQPRLQNGHDEILEIEPDLFLCNFPIKIISTIHNTFPNYLYVLSWNYKYAKLFPNSFLIYDFVDEIDVFEGNRASITKYHKWLLEKAKIVLATSKQLYEQVHLIRQDVILCPNGVDYEFFSKKTQEEVPPPPDLLPILGLHRPIIGYYGALARWFDFDLWKEAAYQKKDFSFVMIGPDYDGSLPPDLLSMPNVFWLGVKSYEELPLYLKYFDVATIPFKVNKITDAVSPLKLFEYMAGKKPIVSTNLKEITQYTGILIALDINDFIELLDKALLLGNDPTYLAYIDDLARKNSWGSRASLILKMIESLPE